MDAIINKNCGIYKITSPTGKIYIGQSINIKRRFRTYNKPSGAKGQASLENSFKKYGVENHQFDIIEYCSIEDLNCSERFWQDQFDVIGKNGLNCILQECGEQRRIVSEETAEKIRVSKIGDKNPMYGKIVTEETRKKQGDSMRGTKRPQYSNTSRITMQELRKNKDGFFRGSNPNANIILDMEMGIFYDCAKDACEAKNINYLSFTQALSPTRGRGNYRGLICIDNCVDKIPEITPKYASVKRKIINTVTGEVYESIKAASKILNMNYSTLKSKINGYNPNNTNLIYYNEQLQ